MDKQLAIDLASFRTLEMLGYTYNGGEYWKPPLGKVDENVTCFDLMFYGCQSINAPQAMEILRAIKAGKIHGVTFTGSK